MEERVYRIRAHHGMCLAFFEGKGYSSEFTEHMAQVQKLLEKNPAVCITAEVDMICSHCPNRQGGICTAAGKVLEYDRQVLLRCGIHEGTIMPFLAFDGLVRDRILLTGGREEICGDCQWTELCRRKDREQGTCEDKSREE
ncbi:MAG: DUF1284 domain-containing protein [Lachnospiraceae bacterium]|nr:DUF1284 domain-containing protein [Lachnospiraceae bacterium]